MKLFKGQINWKDEYKLKTFDYCFEVYDEQENFIYLESSNGYWYKREYDNKGNVIYWEDSDGDWAKREYDEQGNRVYYENSKGEIIDNRIPIMTIKEAEQKYNIKIKKD